MAAVENVAVPDAKKWLHSSFYKEALDNVVSYNAQAMKERRGRLPYVDAQTGIAQADNYNWKKCSDRQRGILPGDVCGARLLEVKSPTLTKAHCLSCREPK
jgi:hypothetical protein